MSAGLDSPMSKSVAEPFDCAICHRRIGSRQTHYVTELHAVIGPCCAFGRKSTIPAHAQLHPDCPVPWHDLWDHALTEAPSRAAACWWLNRGSSDG
jgi:hypothetical protein